MLPACGLLQLFTPAVFMSNYQDAITFGALYRGMRKCRRGVMWKDSVAGYTANGLKNTYILRQELLNGKYQLRPYQCFIVTDPKRREVMATQIRDRQFQRSLCDEYLYHELTRHFIHDNGACQTGKGVNFALDRMDTHLHRYYRKFGADGYVLRCDIHHYFASTPHEVAKAAIRKRVSDPDVCRAVEQIIDSFGGDTGIGLGSQVSQLIELAVLDDMDHFIKERLGIRYYERYMDDFVLIHPDKAYLQHCLAEIRKLLDGLGLELNSKTQIFPLKQGIIWLKWRFILTDSGKVVRKMNEASITKQRRKLKRMRRLIDDGKISVEDVRQSMESWVASAKRGNTRDVVDRMWALYRELFDDDHRKRNDS